MLEIGRGYVYWRWLWRSPSSYRLKSVSLMRSRIWASWLYFEHCVKLNMQAESSDWQQQVFQGRSLRINKILHRLPMQTERSQPEGKRIFLEMRFTEFPAFSVDPRVGVSRSASETDVWLFFLPMTLKIVIRNSFCIRPFEKRPYYVIPLGVRPSVRL